jgi:hypothetical protein
MKKKALRSSKLKHETSFFYPSLVNSMRGNCNSSPGGELQEDNQPIDDNHKKLFKMTKRVVAFFLELLN